MKWGGSGHIPIINHLLSSRSGYTTKNLWLLNNLISGRAFRVSVEIIYPFSGCRVKPKLNLSVPRPLISPESHLTPPDLLLPRSVCESEPERFSGSSCETLMVQGSDLVTLLGNRPPPLLTRLHSSGVPPGSSFPAGIIIMIPPLMGGGCMLPAVCSCR